MRTFRVHCGLLGLFLLPACAGTVDRRVDPDAPDAVGGAALQSQDIRTMATRMAASIRESGILTTQVDNQRTTFHITELANQSSDNINKQIVLAKLETDLFEALGGRVRVLDRSAEGLEAVQREREAKRSNAVTSNEGRRGDVLGSDYVLKGTIRDRVQQSGSMKSAYYLVTFELTDLETSEKVWMGSYETKFESEKSVITR
jgi:PBP1b-binding outer membrane lipoprotein LpoB